MLNGKLTYSRVMATIAFFVAIGGGAWAVAVDRNSIGAREIAKNAVGTSELKNNAATGKDIAEASLGRVPSAGKIGGLVVRKFNVRQAAGTAAEPIVDLAGLHIRMSCAPGNLTATTTKDNSSIFVWGIYTGIDSIESDDLEGQDFELGETFDIDDNMGDFGDPDLGTLLYENADGTVVTIDLMTDANAGGGGDCQVAGTAVGG
jgi:hypothetical protein